jgi:putative oxidoreductase
MKRTATIVTWLLQVLLFVVMMGPGVQKFTSPVWQRMFRVWGYPEHFYLVIGAIEMLAAIGLLVPRLASASALTLMAVMAGAAVTRWMNSGSAVGELVFLTLLGCVAYSRWPGILATLIARLRAAAGAHPTRAARV